MATPSTTAGAEVTRAASASASTSARDYLYRALYLRREMLILTTQKQSSTISTGDVAAPSNKSVVPPTATDAAASSVIQLNDVLLLPPLYGVEGLTAASRLHSSDATSTSDAMLTLEHAWRGLVHIRGPASPWYRGCFAFYVYFPSRYPFEPPIIELAGPLRSHPLVQERRVLQLDHLSTALEGPSEVSSRAAAAGGAPPHSSGVTVASTTASAAVGRRAFVPFEDVYAGLDPMKVSVMAAVLQHVLRLFYPAEWTASMEAAAAAAGRVGSGGVNRVLARRDVERRSVTQEVMLGRPFEQYVDTDVTDHFLQLWDCVAAGAGGDVTSTVEGGGADWYTREVLPHLLHS